MSVLAKRLDVPLTKDMKKLCSVFGGGIGRSGCVCGALVGSLAIAAIVHGEAHHDSHPSKGYAIAKRIHDSFKKNNGSTCCRLLRENFTKPRSTCVEIIRRTVISSTKIIGKPA
jgi:C_GCAxxG_C_C family probable redox protein